ncbi:MAG TPA: histidinol-phosphatase HisJ family protein [Verrucomicrobiota bacterium]|nr:histidinol-phosphatase HisJ family protein [Verrucomicrobiota bacterium]HNT14208.1 histidinol-phosphatase HisJ family protein [Verrucomicrobiota bacterium]
MQLPPDYHLHTPLCRHAQGEPVDYARRAAELGFSEIGFSDHAPMARDDFDDWRMLHSQLGEYVEKVRQAQREVPQLTIRLALEVDYLPGQEAWIQQLATEHAWDYLIGSVHYVTEDWAIDNPHQLARWQDHEISDVWCAYFDRLTQAAASGLFNIIGHADLPKKFGHRPAQDCTPLYRRLLAAAKSQACAIELNTAGLRKDCREIYPSRELLALAQAAGVPITFGSDAHRPEELGAGFAAAVQLARDVGYRQSLRFVGRTAQQQPL